MDRTSWRYILQIYNLFPRQLVLFIIIIYAVVPVWFVAVIIILGESIIIISYLRFILVSVRVECNILIAAFLLHILFELCFPIPQSVKATIRHYSYYSLFAIRHYSRLFAVRCSLFAIRVFQTPFWFSIGAIHPFKEDVSSSLNYANICYCFRIATRAPYELENKNENSFLNLIIIDCSFVHKEVKSVLWFNSFHGL